MEKLRDSQAKTEQTLRRAIRLSVLEAPPAAFEERGIRRGNGGTSGLHATTEASLKAFVDSLRAGGNWHPKG
jgi:hypothetical protein